MLDMMAAYGLDVDPTFATQQANGSSSTTDLYSQFEHLKKVSHTTAKGNRSPPVCLSVNESIMNKTISELFTKANAPNQADQDPNENLTVADDVSAVQATDAVQAEAVEKVEPVYFLVEKEFNDKTELDLFLQQEKCWAKKKEDPQKRGMKTIYRCNLVRKRGKQCSHSIYTVHDFEPNNPKIILYRNNKPHDHENIVGQPQKVSAEVKQMIIDLYTKRNKARAISLELNRILPEKDRPSYQKIKNIIEMHNKKTGKSGQTTMNDIVEFVNAHSALPVDDDEAFVVNFERSPSDESDPQKVWFRLFVSTKRLLQVSINSDCIHADGTQKITTENYPVLVFGSTDKSQQFHLIGLAVSKHERGEDYKFVFDSIQEGMKRVANRVIQPRVIVSDAAHAIQNGYIDSFGEPERVIMCWTHVMINFSKAKFRDQGNRELLRKDLHALQGMSNETFFDIGADLLIAKWSEKEPEYIRTFERSFIRQNKYWFEGAAKQVPKTNNATESFNKSMKLNQTFWEKNAMKSFLPRLLEIVSERSADYAKNKQYVETVPIDNKLQKKGLEYANSEKKFLMKNVSVDGQQMTQFYVFSGEKSRFEIEGEDVDKFLQTDWLSFSSFDEFVAAVTSIYTIEFPNEPKEWMNAECTCVQFSKKFMCKHILALAIRMGILKGVDYDAQPLAPKRKPGRPKKAGPALSKE